MAGKTESDDLYIRPFYVYEIYDENKKVIYVGKGIKRRAAISMRQRNGASYAIVKRFESESSAFEYEAKLIEKYDGLLNKIKGGYGGSVLKGDKETRLMKEIGTRAYAARMLLRYYLAFKALSSKVDEYYSKELQDIFNAMNPQKLIEVGYGAR